jgi:hypothetical protein
MLFQGKMSYSSSEYDPFFESHSPSYSDSDKESNCVPSDEGAFLLVMDVNM